MDWTTFRDKGVRVGRLWRIDIWLHWSLLLLFLYDAYRIWIEYAKLVKLGTSLSGGFSALVPTVGLFALTTLFVLLSILLHEFGHCFAARQVGGDADRVVLWPLGGLAYCDAPRLPRSQFWVSFGGPLVNLALIPLTGLLLVWWPLGSPQNPFVSGRLVDYLHEGVRSFFHINLFLCVFNLLPIYPLDGGRIFHALLWGRTGSYGRAGVITVWTSRIAIGVTFILSFLPVPPFNRVSGLLFLVLIWAFFRTQQFSYQLQEEESDSEFGYDFSRGYTSLERTMPAVARTSRPRKPSLLARWRRRRLDRLRQAEAALRHEVDTLLDKISRDGMSSLTPKERRTLEQASRKLGATRDGS